MDDIAREAGLTKPILYAYFGDKAGLAGALAQRYLGELLPAVLQAFVAGAPVADAATAPAATRGEPREPREMVRAAIDIFIGFVEREPDVYRFLVRGVGGDERSFIEQTLITEFGLRLAQVLRGALRTAGVDTGPAELWSFSILGTVLAGAEWWQVRPAMSRADVVDYLTAFVWGGLTAGGVAGLDASAVFAPTSGNQLSSNEE